MTMEINPFAEYGLIGIIIGVLFLIVWRMLIWVMAFIKEMKNHHDEERKCWIDILNRINKSIEEHSVQAREFHGHVNEAHKFQREEHMKQLDTMSYVLAGFKQVEETLGRINGYRKD